MSSNRRRELHLRVRGVEQLRVPGRPSEPLDVYCIASYGHVRHRTRLIEDTTCPDWNEEFVFDASLFDDKNASKTDPVIKFEIFSQGLFRDELLFCAYLDLEVSGLLELLQLQQLKSIQGTAKPRPSTAGSSQRSSITDSVLEEVTSADAAAIAAVAAGLRRPSEVSTVKVPGAAAARAAADEAALAAASAAFHASCGAKGITGTGCPGFSTEVQTHLLALLAAQTVSSGGSMKGTGSPKARGPSDRGLAKMRLKRSSHVSTIDMGDLEIDAWWVQQPSLGNAGTPPRVISFVHPPGAPHPLPSATHSTLSSQWEEPALAFVRLVVNKVHLGSAAAAAAASAAASDPSSSSSSYYSRRSKAVLQRLTTLLKEDGVCENEDSKQQQQQRRPTLSQIHAPKSLSVVLKQGTSQQTPSSAVNGAKWVWEAPDVSDPDESESSDFEDGDSQYGNFTVRVESSQRTSQRSSQQTSKGLGRERLAGVFRRSSEDGALTGDEAAMTGLLEDSESEDELASLREFEQGTTTVFLQAQKTSRSSGNGTRSKASQKKEVRRQMNRRLYLTIKLQLGDQKQKALRSVPVRSDGLANICQSAVFAAVRPLQDGLITYQMGLGLGPRGPPLLVLSFQYSLLHLLKRSPERPVQWQQWREVARCTVNGLQVPLPGLAGSFLDLSAFLADVDCRAGMYCIPPVAPAALAAAAAEDAAAAAAAAAALATAAAPDGEDQPLTDSDTESNYASSYGGISTASASAATAAGAPRAVLRRRAGSKRHQSAAAAATAEVAAAERKRGLSKIRGKLKDRAAAGVGKVLVRVEEGLNQALEKLPATVAQQVKESSFIKKVFPGARRSEVFAIGQLRVPTFKQPGAAPAAAGVAPAPLSAPNPWPVSQPGSGSSTPLLYNSRCNSNASTASGSSAAVGGCSPRCGAGAAAAAGDGGGRFALQRHPNVATAGGPNSRPLGVLQLTLQAITLRSSSSNPSGVQLLMRCGPHWLQLQQPALPITFYSTTGSSNNSSSGCGVAERPPSFTAAINSSRVAPVQVLVPVFGNSCLVTLVMHRRGNVVGRCVFKLYGLLPLLLRDHSKTLTLYSDKRGSGGQRVIAGSVLVRLAAGPPPSYSRLMACIRLAYSYIITPHTLDMHTSGVLRSISKDERDDAAGEVIVDWLASAGQQGKHAIPESLVNQLVSTGRGRVSGARMRGHVRRIKAVMLDWLPRRVDPLAFYHWKKPLNNILIMWIMSHVCLHPGKWAFVMVLILTVTLLRRMAIQIRRGVLGFELEQLPPDMAAAAGLPAQQQQQPDRGRPSDCGMSDGVRDSQSSFGPLGDSTRYREAADRLRAKLSPLPGKLPTIPSIPPPPTFPKSADELREQLENGTLDLDTLDIEAVSKQLLSVGGLLRLARQHGLSVRDYALVVQNILDDAAGFAEGLYAMCTAQDPLAALVFCTIILVLTGFAYRFGMGALVYVIMCILLRPPFLRGVPGVFGWKALLANLPSRSVEELAW